MNSIRSLVILTILIAAQISNAAPKTVLRVDPVRYAGSWYQIARNPLFFEDGCVCSLQKLAINSAGSLDVLNTCNDRKVNGPLKTIQGTATPDDSTFSKFTVDFGLPHKGQYWIIGLADDYRYAVVSDSSEKSLYILSKTPTLDDASYHEAVALAAAQLDTSKLQLTEQANCVYP